MARVFARDLARVRELGPRTSVGAISSAGPEEGHNIAPLRHMREGPDGRPSRPRDPKRKFEEGYAWGNGS